MLAISEHQNEKEASFASKTYIYINIYNCEIRVIMFVYIISYLNIKFILKIYQNYFLIYIYTYSKIINVFYYT